MSFIPPPPQIDYERAKAREQELELKAEHYAQQHGDQPPSGRRHHLRQLAHRLSAAISSHRA